MKGSWKSLEEQPLEKHFKWSVLSDSGASSEDEGTVELVSDGIGDPTGN
jgi:hypothetical protein